LKAIDTNVLVRFLVRDDQQQADIVYNLFKKTENQKDRLFLPGLVLLETIWVLESVYEIKRHEIIDAVDVLLSMPVLAFQSQPAVRRFISLAKKSNTDLPDLLIATAAEAEGCEKVLTFDRQAAKSPLFELLEQ
jgi:predicted nucleic-acid-binding protein